MKMSTLHVLLVQFMDKIIEVKDATRHALKHGEHRSSSVDGRHTTRVRLNFFLSFFFSFLFFFTCLQAVKTNFNTSMFLLFVFQSETDWSIHSSGLDSSVQNQLKQENAHLKIALAQRYIFCIVVFFFSRKRIMCFQFK